MQIHSLAPHHALGAGPPRRRDRRAVGASRGRHRAPPRPHPRVRRPRRLEHGLPLLRRLAELAGRTRPGRGPGTGPRGARPRDAAAPGPGPRPRGAVVRQGPRPDPRRHAGDRSAPARRWGAPARPPTSSGSCAAGGAWTGRPRRGRPRDGTRAGRCTSYQDEDGTVVVRGRLEPEVGALLMQALAAARETLYQRARARDEAASEPWRRFRGNAHAWPSSRPTRWPCSRRRPSTTGSIPAPRASATRWWSTSTPRCWPIRSSPASPCSRTARAFPRKRPSAWRATRAGW